MTPILNRLRGRRPLPLAGRAVLITGAGSGIGRLMALEAARRGAAVVHVWDRDDAAARTVAAEVAALGARGEAACVDVTDTAAVEAAAARAEAVDVLVNNAGVVTGTPLLETTEEGIRRTFEVNALAGYWTTRALLPGMLERGRGAVVTVASAAGLVGVARQTDYSASKHAAVGFAESLRAELRRADAPVTSLVVCPFYISTGMFAGVRTKVPALLPILEPEAVAAQVVDAVEAGRERLVLPPAVQLIAPLRALPVPAFDRVMDVLGVNRAMDGFTGRR
ncbi:SDR family oxidoreductase [Micrococcus porci]|uniref:SDR family oxidoreductase n=1 Tax=Micrococcus porci TaxID=2856555 RepID=UPI001CCF6BFB|nr:SDR family oxidoreductase [Micrococcus porci]UBH24085.1 SDR family oxidoreductase [Micrococcus porci]